MCRQGWGCSVSVSVCQQMFPAAQLCKALLVEAAVHVLC
jgi:hypothetical protein